MINNYSKKISNKASKPNRILFFIHYNKKAYEIDAHVVYWLTKLRPLFNKIIFISNSKLDDKNLVLVENHSDKVLMRNNEGFDFGGWKEALLDDGWESLGQYDNITMLNDTCFGPLFNLEEFYAVMEADKIDFWGNTNHRQMYSQGWDYFIPEHIQSYFMVFSQQVVKSGAFQKFWQSVENKANVLDVIIEYETQFTSLLMSAGFKYKVLIDTTTKEYEEYNPNLGHCYPEVLLDNKSPFIKIKSFTELNIKVKSIERKITDNTNYPLPLMHSFLSKVEKKPITQSNFLRRLYKLLPNIIKQTHCIQKIKTICFLHLK